MNQQGQESPVAPRRQRYKLTIAYDGTHFHGWQKQQPPDRVAPRTVAGELESCLQRVLQQPIDLVGASRTDAGVHARGQVAHLDAATTIPLPRIALAINSRLAEDVEVLNVEAAPADFDAIVNAKSKQYRYRIFNSHHRPLEKRHHVWHCWWSLDIARMSEAAARLVGTHDFVGFACAAHGRQTTVRTIHDCRVVRESLGCEVHLVVQGSGFLYNMVRIIAGTLVDVGRGRLEPQVIDHMLHTGQRRLGGSTLPAAGLWLEWIRY